MLFDISQLSICDPPLSTYLPPTPTPPAIAHPAPAPPRPQHQYHTKIDDLIERTLSGMVSGLVAKLVSVLEAVIAKLGRYDEGSLIGSILSFTVRKRPDARCW